MFTCVFLIVSCIATLGIGGFIFALAICEDIKIDLSSIQKSGKRAENKSKIVEQLSQFIQYHSEMKQLSQCCTSVLFVRETIISKKKFLCFPD